MVLQKKRTDIRGVGIRNMRKSIYLLITTPTSHTHSSYRTDATYTWQLRRTNATYVTCAALPPGRMPHICDMQNARCFTALFSKIPAFRQVLRVPQSISFYRSTFN